MQTPDIIFQLTASPSPVASNPVYQTQQYGSMQTAGTAKGMMDMMIAQQMMSILQGSLHVDGISWQRVSELIVFMCLDDVKNMVVAAFVGLKLIVGNNYATAWQHFVAAMMIIYKFVVKTVRTFNETSTSILASCVFTHKPGGKDDILLRGNPCLPGFAGENGCYAKFVDDVAPVNTLTVRYSKSNVILERIFSRMLVGGSLGSQCKGYHTHPDQTWEVENLESSKVTQKWFNIEFDVGENIKGKVQGTVDVTCDVTRGTLRLAKINGHVLGNSGGPLQHIVDVGPCSTFSGRVPYTRYKGDTSISALWHWENDVRDGLEKISKDLDPDSGAERYRQTHNVRVSFPASFNHGGITFNTGAVDLHGYTMDKLAKDACTISMFLCFLNSSLGADGEIKLPEKLSDFSFKCLNYGAIYGVTYIDGSVPNQNILSIILHPPLVELAPKIIKYLQSCFTPRAFKRLCLRVLAARNKIAVYFGDTSTINALNYNTTPACLESVIRNVDHPSESNSTTSTTSTPFTIILESATVKPDDMSKQFIEFTNEIVKTGPVTQKTAHQKVFTVAITRKRLTLTEPNPEYTDWEASARSLMSIVAGDAPSIGITDAKDKDNCSAHVLRHIPSPPPRTLSTSTIETTITHTETKSDVFKPFDTLYLSAGDHKRIHSSLEVFRDRHELLQSLGLPNKYGLLLYGPPGTGKTSTIYAVATELQQPIWYIQLTDDMTCGDLRKMFEHVYKVNGGGIVIFEDIDRMTGVVHATAKEVRDASVCTIMNSDDAPLNLSYFLSFMDGALSQHRSVIIATTNNPEKLDPAFKRAGRFDICVELRKANHDQIRAIYRKMLRRDVSPEVLARIPIECASTADVIYRVKDFMMDCGATDETILAPFIV